MKIDVKDNSLNFVRMFAALQVLFLHANTHLGLGMNKLINILSLFTGVPIFFCITGFLMAYSLQKKYGMKEYFEKRILRIYPELWGGVIISSACILIFYKEAINVVQFVVFNVTQATFMQFYTPDFLRGYGVGTPNGSLWTITITVQFYIVFYFVYPFLKKQKMTTWIVIIMLLSVTNVATLNLDQFLPEIIYSLYLQTLLPYLYMFLIGSFIFNFNETVIPILTRYFYLLLTILLVINYFNITLQGIYLNPLKGVLLCLLAISFAFKFNNLKVKIDLSYGIFIYHMIIVNVFVQLGINGNVVSLIGVILLSALFAYSSNKMIGTSKNKTRSKVKIAS